MPVHWTRRQFLGTGLKTGAGLVVLGAAGYGGYRWPHGSTASTAASTTPQQGVDSFVSRPDLTPAHLTVTVNPRLRTSGAPSSVILAPRGYALGAPGQSGVMVAGSDGHLIWFRPTAGTPMDLNVQSYQGKPVLTWWEGDIINGYGNGTGQIVDETYAQVATVHGGNGLQADLHEFLLTPQGTALITAYRSLNTDLTSVGGPASGPTLEGVVQEIDVATGAVLFEWRSLDHVALTETYLPSPGPSPTAPFDYFHVNSIDVAPDGDLLVGARNTWAVYKVSRSSGAIVWRLGGRRSNFAVASDATFYWQHDVRAQGANTISLFDDGATPTEEQQSRGLVLALDTAQMRATLSRQYTHPARLLAPNQGSMQVLASGGAFVGWGAEPYFSQFAADGTILLDGRLPNNVQSYRTYVRSWTGRPTDTPAIAVRSSAVVGTTVYASWNGSTELAEWQVLAGAGAPSLSAVARARRTGFETSISVASSGPYYAVVALDRTGAQLGRSAAVQANALAS
jgi:hypothetical protein